MLETREHMYLGIQIEIIYLLTVLVSIPLNDLPCIRAGIHNGVKYFMNQQFHIYCEMIMLLNNWFQLKVAFFYKAKALHHTSLRLMASSTFPAWICYAIASFEKEREKNPTYRKGLCCIILFLFNIWKDGVRHMMHCK